MNNKQINFYILLLLVALSFVVRVLYITANPISNDEPFTIFNSQQNLNDLFHLFAHENNPPLHFILLHFWMKLFGTSAFSVRLLSTVFGALTVIPIFKIGNEFFTRKVGIITSLLFCFSTLHIEEAHDARVYTTLVFLVVLSYYFFLKILKDQKDRYSKIAYTITLILMLYSHYISGVVLVSQFVVTVFSKPDKWKKIKSVFVGQLISVIVFLPFLKVFIYRISQTTQNESWVPKPTIASLFNLIRQFFNQPVVAILAILSLIGFLIVRFSKSKQVNKSTSDTLLMWFIIPYFLVFAVSFFSSLFLAKYLIFASVGFYFIIACFWDDFTSNFNRFQFLAYFPVVFMMATVDFKSISNRRPDLMVLQVKGMQSNSTAIYVCPEWEMPVFTYYYNPGIFKDYTHSKKRLTEENVFFILSENEVNRADLEDLQQLIIVDNKNSLVKESKDVFNIQTDFNLSEEVEIYPYKIYRWSKK